MKRPRTTQNVAGRGPTQPAASTTSLGILGSTGWRSSQRRINRKWAWHYRTLLKLCEQLLRERGERLAEVSQPLESHSMNIADSATDEFDHDLALAELSAEQDSLLEVEAAIRRIHSGTYGVCEATGKRIAAARLKAIPWTRFARDVEARLEKGGEINHPHLGQIGVVRPLLAADLNAEEADVKERAASDEAMTIFSPPPVSAKSDSGKRPHT